MRPIANLITFGLAVALLAACAPMQSEPLDYPVEMPTLSAQEQQDVDKLVKAFNSGSGSMTLPQRDERRLLDETEQQRLREAREPFDNIEPGSQQLNMLQEEQDERRRQRMQERDAASAEYSRGEINAIERRVSRKYESRHDIRHELKSKYGL